MHIFKRNVGQQVLFQGFDGKNYEGYVIGYRNGVAKLEYPVRVSDGTLYQVTAYVDRKHHNRISAAQ